MARLTVARLLGAPRCRDGRSRPGLVQLAQQHLPAREHDAYHHDGQIRRERRGHPQCINQIFAAHLHAIDATYSIHWLICAQVFLDYIFSVGISNIRVTNPMTGDLVNGAHDPCYSRSPLRRKGQAPTRTRRRRSRLRPLTITTPSHRGCNRTAGRRERMRPSPPTPQLLLRVPH